MTNKLFFIGFLSLWAILFNVMISHTQIDYHEILEIKSNPNEDFTEIGKNQINLKYYAKLEDDIHCKIYVLNIHMMENIIENIKDTDAIYYTTYDTLTKICSHPITWNYVIAEKIFNICSIILLSFTCIIAFINYVLKIKEYLVLYRITSITRTPGITHNNNNMSSTNNLDKHEPPNLI